MNIQRVLTVAHKDLIEVVRNKQAMFPMLVIPLGLAVMIPFGIIVMGSDPTMPTSAFGLSSLIDQLPKGILPPDLSESQKMVYAFTVYFMAPVFLLIPSMSATVIGSSSFVGEKERRTIEGLLYTPVTDRELVLAKIIASLVPAIVITWGSFGAYVFIVDTFASPVIGERYFPTANWYALMFLVVPLLAFLTVALIVAVSGRATSSQGAQGVSFLVVMPMILLTMGQTTGIMLFSTTVALVFAAVLVVVDVVVLYAVAGVFHRERLLTKLL